MRREHLRASTDLESGDKCAPYHHVEVREAGDRTSLGVPKAAYLSPKVSY